MYKKIILLVSLVAFTTTGFSQKGKIRKALREYKDFAYAKTADMLLHVAEDGYESEELFQKLANSYYFNNKMEDAAKWYERLLELNESQEAEYYFRYAQALKTTGNYEESDRWMERFSELNTYDKRARYFTATKDYLEKIEESSREFDIYNLNINTERSDFGAMQYQDKFIYASALGDGEIYEWNEQPYLNLYQAQRQMDSISGRSSYVGAKTFNKQVSTNLHESSAAFTPDGRFMFFTRNNIYKKRERADKEGINRLKLFRAEKGDEGDWSVVTPIHFNSDNYSVAHPTINASGTKMYFASDMPGTTGLSDLYVTTINHDGTLGEPQNLVGINTEGQETFPFINSEGDLFFASNGYPGLGGLDIFVIRNFEAKSGNPGSYVVESVGKPINSAYDDFAYYENVETDEGFFTSNRPGGKGDDDIYSFKIPGPCSQEVAGVVRNKRTKELIPNATVTLFDATGKELARTLSDENAAFSFTPIDCDTEYLVRGEKITYSPDEKRFNTPKTDVALNLELGLDLGLELFLDPPYEEGDDIAHIMNIDIIYFDFDKDYIRSPDATAQLQKVILFMKTYPTVHVDVRSHTDSRAPDDYNMDLSQRRNKNTIDYIVRGGISRSRLTGRGYGESQLVNECSNGVKCSEDEHQLNRRSEFIITQK